MGLIFIRAIEALHFCSAHPIGVGLLFEFGIPKIINSLSLLITPDDLEPCFIHRCVCLGRTRGGWGGFKVANTQKSGNFFP